MAESCVETRIWRQSVIENLFILLYTITKIFGDSKGIEKIHIEDLIKLCSNNIGNKYLMPNKNLKVLVKNGQIYFIDQRQVSVES